MQYKLATLAAAFLLSANVFAQDLSNVPITDGFDAMMQKAKQANPNFDVQLQQLHEDIAQRAAALDGVKAKTTATVEIPIVFHVVLTANQIKQMGSVAGIEERIKSQIDALNEDFNGTNADQSTIPAAFKPLFGNMNIKFSLCHKDPQGNYTPGYEIVTTTKSGFDAENGTIGSKSTCSDAKFTSTGGADAWDTKKYMNVWVINITPAGVGGLGTPPPYPVYGGTGMFPWNEQGIALGYGFLGKKTKSGQYFPASSATNGRTLVHEMGHFFNLFHPFGISTMDNSSCTDDDGVGDTPKESGPVQSICPAYPYTDACSPASPGVMFMNHMDYSSDDCRTMFTKQQASRSNVELASGGYRETLTQNPDLIYYWPSSVKELAGNATVSVYPNPASNNCIIEYAEAPVSIFISNSIGQVVRTVNNAGTHNTIVDLGDVPTGIYLLHCIFAKGTSNTQLQVVK